MTMMMKRVVKVLPYGASSTKTVSNSGNVFTVSALAGNTIAYQFPHGVIDLSTLRFLFDWVSLHPTSPAPSQTLPRDTETLIDELEVMLGDTVVNKISNHQQLFFMLSTYSKTSDWIPAAGGWQRAWTNRRVNPTPTNFNGWTFCMEHFLGLLGCGKVIDTRKVGKLTVRIRLGDSATVNQSSAAATWGMLDPYFRVHYLPDSYTGTSERIAFDDFTSIRQYFPGYDGRTTLIVDGRKKIDYVIARCVNVSNHDNKQVGQIDAGVLVSQRFVSTAINIASWDFLVNGTPLHAYEADIMDGIASMFEVFPDGVMNISNNANPEVTNSYTKLWACGVRLDLPQREDGQQNELSIETTAAPGGGAAFPQYTFLYAKTTSTIDATSGKLEISV